MCIGGTVEPIGVGLGNVQSELGLIVEGEEAGWHIMAGDG